MARIELRIDNPANRMVLKSMLDADGHETVSSEPELLFCDDLALAATLTDRAPVIVAVQAAEIPGAVRAMRHGVYGYILVPFQPGEASMMVNRAMAAGIPKHAAPMRSMDEVEKEHILEVYRRCKRNCAEASRVLGMGRNTVWRKLKSYGAIDAGEGRS